MVLYGVFWSHAAEFDIVDVGMLLCVKHETQIQNVSSLFPKRKRGTARQDPIYVHGTCRA
jgi:hypothetical protein